MTWCWLNIRANSYSLSSFPSLFSFEKNFNFPSSFNYNLSSCSCGSGVKWDLGKGPNFWRVLSLKVRAKPQQFTSDSAAAGSFKHTTLKVWNHRHSIKAILSVLGNNACRKKEWKTKKEGKKLWICHVQSKFTQVQIKKDWNVLFLASQIKLIECSISTAVKSFFTICSMSSLWRRTLIMYCYWLSIENKS